MRVMCIDNQVRIPSPFNDSLKLLKEGETYTVICEVEDGLLNRCMGYLLAEIKSSHPTKGYGQTRFIPLTDDEIETPEYQNQIKLYENN